MFGECETGLAEQGPIAGAFCRELSLQGARTHRKATSGRFDIRHTGWQRLQQDGANPGAEWNRRVEFRQTEP